MVKVKGTYPCESQTLELFNNRGSAADYLSFFILGLTWIHESFVYILINFINFKINKNKFFNRKFLILAPPDDVNENKFFSCKFLVMAPLD